MALAALDRFVPAPVHADGRVAVLRARFLVVASFTLVACSLVFSGLFLATGTAGWTAVAPILMMGALCAPIPFLLRAGVSPQGIAVAFVGVVQCGLIASVMADRGLSDPGVMWIAMTPLIAAFAGGTRLAWGSAGSGATLVLALLTLERRGVLTSYAEPGYDLVVVVNALGCIAVVASLSVLYDGPIVRHFRHLSQRLAATNEDLRAELAERERAQTAAEAASRAKDVLLANMSHEFRTPLTAILGFTEVLASEAIPEHEPFLSAIDRGAARLLSTLDGVLDLAWIESGTGELPAEPCDVSREALAVVEALRPAARERGLALSHCGPPAVAWVAPAALRRVLTALVDNAVRFTDQGAVTVSTAADAESVRLSVSDTGPGMSADAQVLAFEPFRQLSEGDARTHEGMGLGLAVARRLVRSMGGTIGLASVPGGGTTVTVALPPAAPPPNAPTQTHWISKPVAEPASA